MSASARAAATSLQAREARLVRWETSLTRAMIDVKPFKKEVADTISNLALYKFFKSSDSMKLKVNDLVNVELDK